MSSKGKGKKKTKSGIQAKKPGGNSNQNSVPSSFVKSEVEEPHVFANPPSIHQPWSSLIWGQEKLEKYLKDASLGHGTPYTLPTTNGNCTAIIHIFENDQDQKYPNEFQLKVSIKQTIISFLMDAARVLKMPLTYYMLFPVGSKKFISGVGSLEQIFQKDGTTLHMWAVQVPDMKSYQSNPPAVPVTSTNSNGPALPTDMSTMTAFACKAFGWTESNLTNASSVTPAQWKDYYENRMALQQKMTAFLKKCDEEALLTATKDSICQILGHLKSDEVKDEHRAKYQAISNGFYAFKGNVSYDEDGESLDSCRLTVRYYSPFVIGNYVDFFVFGFEKVGYYVDMEAVVQYIAGSFQTSQTTEKIEKTDEMRPSKKKYICKTEMETPRNCENRYLISTKELMALQKHLFADKLKLSPYRFWNFIFAASGAEWICDNSKLFWGLRSQAKNSFERDPSSEGEEEEWKIYGGKSEAPPGMELFEVSSNISEEREEDEEGEDFEEDEDIGEDEEDEMGDEEADMLRERLKMMMMNSMMEGGRGGRGGARGGRGGGGRGRGECPTQ